MTKRKNNKRALTLSLLSLLLCVSMLVGATFAWFTDTASTSVNTIQSGTLDVDLVDANGNTLVGQTLDFVKAQGTDAILWEPGCTYNLSEVYVKNNGNLALKYMIEITGIQGSAKLNEVIEWTIDYGYGDNATEGHLTAGATSAAITISGHMKEDAGNEYQNLTIDGISITVRATQDTVEYDSYNNTYDANAAYDMSAVTPGEGEGEGSEDDGSDYPFVLDKDTKTITVYNASDFAMLAEGFERFGLGENDYPSQYTLKLGKSINYGGGTLSEPIEAWWGNMDGQGYTISNVKVNTSVQWAGLFAPDAQEYTLNVSNLTLDNISVTSTYSDGFTGALAGYAANANITNVTVTNATVTGTKYTGGIIGQAGSTHLIGCSVSDATITGTRIGGIVGDAFCEGGSASIQNCSVNNVTLINTATDGLTGEIAGRLRNDITAENCTAANVNYIFNVSNDTGLTAALTAAGTDSTEIILADGTYDFTKAGTALQNKNVTFSGSKNAVFDMTAQQGVNNVQALTGTTLTFDGVTVKWAGTDGGYQGIKNPEKVIYRNCDIEGLQYLYGDTDFINCTLTHRAGWSAIAYASKNVTFTGCTFNTGNHAFLLYTDNRTAGLEFKATLTNCTFNNDGSQTEQWGSEQLVECGDNPAQNIKYALVLNNCTINGGNKALWGNKNSMPAERLSITVDGVAQDVSNHPTAN